MVQVRVTTTDGKGEFYPYGENRTYFNVLGAGKIKALDNGSPVDVEQHVGPNHRKAFYGLTRAYIQSTNDSGDINLLASSILGEKKIITSNKVRIDTQIINLRGHKTQPKIEIFYTADGTEPTPNSNSYKSSFEIELETIVKALIVVDGKPMQVWEEKFGKREGFTWNKNTEDTSQIGEQAEDATLNKAKISSDGSNFNGKGFVSMDKTKGASISWYQENDGSAGETDLYVRYSAKFKDAAGTSVKITVNGNVVNNNLFSPNSEEWASSWSKVKTPIQLARGANIITLETLEDKELLVDEILIN